jgi:integrase
MGVQPKLVQELLGHSSINITLGAYGHLMPYMHQDAMDRMDEAFQDDEE